MAAYRVYTASFTFEAREASELSIEEGDTVVVYERYMQYCIQKSMYECAHIYQAFAFNCNLMLSHMWSDKTAAYKMPKLPCVHVARTCSF